MITGSRGIVHLGRFAPLDAGPATTGRSLVLMRNGTDAMQAGMKVLKSVANLTTVRSSDIRSAIQSSEIPTSTALMLESIGVAIVNGDPDQIGRMSVQATRADSILAVEPERVVYAASMWDTASRTTTAPRRAVVPCRLIMRAAIVTASIMRPACGSRGSRHRRPHFPRPKPGPLTKAGPPGGCRPRASWNRLLPARGSGSLCWIPASTPRIPTS